MCCAQSSRIASWSLLALAERSATGASAAAAWLPPSWAKACGARKVRLRSAAMAIARTRRGRRVGIRDWFMTFSSWVESVSGRLAAGATLVRAALPTHWMHLPPVPFPTGLRIH